MTDAAKVVEHYGTSDLRSRIAVALATAGLEGNQLTPQVLAPLDQFHIRGLASTIEFAAAVGVARGAHVVDIGSGLGGPSRYLAATFGCEVHGIDLNPSFVEAATYLTERCGLSDTATFECADALSLPVDDRSADLAWTQHVAMNIADRARMYAEAFRVIRPGGRFAIHDILAGTGELHFPVPWSATPATSFLMTPDAMRSALERQGFRVSSWTDHTPDGIAWLKEIRANMVALVGPPPPLGLHVVMGPGFPEMAGNLARNLEEGRASVVQVVLDRP